MRLTSGVLRDDGKRDFAGVKVLDAFLARDQLAVRRKNGGNPDQVLRRDSRIPEGQLK
jgi:hypothetical protein